MSTEYWAVLALSTMAISGCGSENSGGALARNRVSVRGEGTCLLNPKGEIVCWGGSVDGLSLTATAPFTKVSTGSDGVCGLAEDGRIECTHMLMDGRYIDVSAGERQVCGVTTEGKVRCEGGVMTYPIPGAFRRVSTGRTYTCALDDAGRAACWQSERPVGHVYRPEGTFIDVSAGTNHACTVDIDSQLRCWGDDTWGQNRVPEGRVFIAVDAGEDSTCGVTEDGGVACWGAIRGLDGWSHAGSFVEVTHAASITCAASDEGAIECWPMAATTIPPASVTETTPLVFNEPSECLRYDATSASRFDCESREGFLAHLGLTRVNSVEFEQQFGASTRRNVWVSDHQATLPSGERVSAKSVYAAIRSQDVDARLEASIDVGTVFIHHARSSDRIGVMIKGESGSAPQTNDWSFARYLLDGTPTSATTSVGYESFTCMDCHVKDGRQARTDLLWGVPRDAL